MKIGMRDVAKAADVSVATVSHVLNGTRFVAEATKKRVQDSILALGYSPDPVARSFKTGKKNLVGILVPDISNPFWAIIIEEIEMVLAQKGYHLMIVNTMENEQKELASIKLLSSGIVDGLIVASTATDYHALEQNMPEHFPIVLIDRSLKDAPFDTLTISNYQSMYDGVTGLIQTGHKKIGYITSIHHLSTTVERLGAYMDAMSAHNLPTHSNFIQSGGEDTVRSVKQLLEIGCSAVVVSNNMMADDVLFYLNDLEVNVGHDICLLSYNEDTRRVYNQRKMDMIMQPCSDLGKLAGAGILNRIQDPLAAKQDTLLQSTLMPRIQKKP